MWKEKKERGVTLTMSDIKMNEWIAKTLDQKIFQKKLEKIIKDHLCRLADGWFYDSSSDPESPPKTKARIEVRRLQNMLSEGIIYKGRKYTKKVDILAQSDDVSHALFAIHKEGIFMGGPTKFLMLDVTDNTNTFVLRTTYKAL